MSQYLLGLLAEVAEGLQVLGGHLVKLPGVPAQGMQKMFQQVAVHSLVKGAKPP